MKCPNCYNSVPTNATKCSRCDWELRAASKSSDAMWGNDSLSTNQTWDTQQSAASTMNQWGDAVPVQPQQTVQASSSEQWNDAAKAMIQPSGGVSTTIPLTGSQKTQLMLIGLGPLAVVSIAGFIVSKNTSLIHLPVSIFVVIGIILLYLAIQNLRDLFSGVANVQILRLQKTTRVRQKSGYNYYVQFEGIKSMIIKQEFYDAAQQGALYQVTYSPHSKRLWNAELR